ncbi:MAG: RagB/SusD family nutrient uptake outer membrane protein [Candidatus Azobacteroides sp.]|jgi:tetratricopeptide (TPR) repeat protein|nr:RagB/SusD family nutrient uptake outer membrane protein [Candidatus Azobacteroides sp.]
MKNTYSKNILMAVCCLFLATACNDTLSFQYPGSTLASESFLTSDDAVASATAAYCPLQWEFGGTYFFEWWIGDVCSDDALKGGETVDANSDAFDLENFRTRSDNAILLQYYRAQYIGAFRANFSRENVEAMDPALFPAGLQDRIIGEDYFLRAMYHFRLVRIFGGVPIADHTIMVQSEWPQSRASESDVYAFIEGDLKKAIALLPDQGKYSAADLGRATKGAARALLMKVYMNTGQFDEAKLQGDSIISIDPYRYSLLADFNQNFDFNYDNNNESVFEIQYSDNGMGDFGDVNYTYLGATRSTFTTIFIRPRWGKTPEGTPSVMTGAGWGWKRPSQQLYDEFEPGDMRRDAAIINPSEAQAPYDGETATTLNTYLGNRYHSRKYAQMNPDTTFYPMNNDGNYRSSNNHKEIRYSDVLLMYAEACVKSSTPDLSRAKWALEQVRTRARAFSGGGNVLPSFPNYTIPLQGVGESGTKQLQDNAQDLYLAIQHERRVELALEGHRWFDMKRWGILDKVMNHYRETAQPNIGSLMSPFIKGQHELFPIPSQERDLNPMPQNPGYDGVPVN